MPNKLGPHCPIDLLNSCSYEPYLKYLGVHFDEENYMRGERINGFEQCPKCGVWYPCIEEPNEWQEYEGDNPKLQGKWMASDWWGGTVCEECNLLMIEQPDGRGECYQL